METLPKEFVFENSESEENISSMMKPKLGDQVNRWLNLYQKQKLNQSDFRRYWAEEVPAIYQYTPDCNCLEVSFDESKVFDRLLRPLEQFICETDRIEGKFDELKKLGNPPNLCGKIFKSGEPIYSCRDCGVDQTCVRCVDCFKKSSHKNHKYRVSMSEGGGFCDCGDVEAWKTDPYCEDHLQSQDKDDQSISEILKKLPQDLIGRARLVIRAVVNYCYEVLTWTEFSTLPDHLESKETMDNFANNLCVTVLFNDEVHTYEQVIQTLTRSIECSYKQAMEFATMIDREGRAVIKCSQFVPCNDVRDTIERFTKRNGNKPLKCQVMQLQLVAHQTFAIRLLAWTKHLISQCKALAIVFGTEMLSKTNEKSLAITLANVVAALKSEERDEMMLMMDTEMEEVRSRSGSQNESFMEVRKSRSNSFRPSLSSSKSTSKLTLLELVMRSDVQLWKNPRNLWHELFIHGMFLQHNLKREFAKRFTRQYGQLLGDFIEDDHDYLYSIAHLSIQFYSVPTLSVSMIEQENAMHRMMSTFLFEFGQHFDQQVQMFRREIATASRFRRATFILNDLKHLLGVPPPHWSKKLIRNFLHGFETFLRLLKDMQDMDSVVRQVGQHVEFEPDWDTGINLQLKVAPTIYNIIEWASTHPPLLLKCIRLTLRHLLPKLCAMQIRDYSLHEHRTKSIHYDVASNAISVHLPLSRMICSLLLELTRLQPEFNPASLSSLMPTHLQSIHPLVILMENPLRTLVMVAQFRASIWRRNGYSLVNQVHFYHSTNLREEMYDRDVQLLQIAAAHLDPNEFLIHLLNKFALLSWAELPQTTPENLHRLSLTLLEELLALLLIILSERHQPGIGKCTADDRVKKEIIQRLCIESLTHSDLIRHFSRRAAEMNIEHMINEVADFKRQPGQPGGRYQLRVQFYEHFNPFFYHYTRQDQCSAEQSQLNRKRINRERLICCPPPLPPSLTPHFRPMLQLFSCDVMSSMLHQILKLASEQPVLWYTETLFEKSMHLIGLGLLEQERELNYLLNEEETSPSPQFISMMLNYLDQINRLNLFELLEACEAHCKIESYRHLRLWLKERGQQVQQLMQRWKRMSGDEEENSFEDWQVESNEESKKTSNESPKSSRDRSTESNRSKNSEMAAMRRARIMAQMAAMQNKFIQTNAAYFESEKSGARASGSEETKVKSGDDEQMEESGKDQDSGAPVAIGPQAKGSFIKEEAHQCILCREGQSKKEGQSMVMTAFVQRSTVLSKNRSRPAVISTFTGELIDFCLSADLYHGVHISSCGHLMHSKCWKDFFEIVQAKERRRPMRFGRQVVYDTEKNEYLCPLCGSLSNSVIPLVPSRLYRKELRHNAGHDVKVSVAEMGDALCAMIRDASTILDQQVIEVNPSSAPSDKSANDPAKSVNFRRYVPTELNKALEGFSEETRTAICKLFSVYDEHEPLDNRLSSDIKELMTKLAYRMFSVGAELAVVEPDERLHLLIYSACAFTIHCLERVQRMEGKSTLGDLSSRRYACMQVLVRFVCLSSSLFMEKQLQSCVVRLLQQLLIPEHYQSCTRSCLDFDAFGLLVTLVSTTPSMCAAKAGTETRLRMPLGNAVDQSLLHMLFMLHIVQIILTDGELNTDVSMETDKPVEECSNHENRSIVQFYSKLITSAGIKSPLAKPNQVDYKVAERLALQLKTKLLPFLRCCSVFFHFLSDIQPPGSLFNARPSTTDSMSEYSMLCEYLALPKKLCETLSNRWLVDLAVSWVGHPRLKELFTNSGPTSQTEVPLSLIEQCHCINRLVSMPEDYCELINEVSRYSCKNSDSEDSKMPTMCLVCGKILCSQSFCCQQELNGSTVGACVHHAHVCGAGVGLFLRIRDCKVLLLSGTSKGCFMAAPYVDEYGETDMGLYRGNPLRLCSILYDDLNKLWLQHRIPEKIGHALEQAPQLSNNNWRMY